jgi:hypothetical protein
VNGKLRPFVIGVDKNPLFGRAIGVNGDCMKLLVLNDGVNGWTVNAGDVGDDMMGNEGS